MIDDTQTNDDWSIDISNITTDTSSTIKYATMASGGGGSSTYYSGYSPGYSPSPVYGPTPTTVSITPSSTTYTGITNPATFTVGTSTIGAANPTTANIQIHGKNPTISTEKNSINLDDLAELMTMLRERLLILIPNFEKHEKYQALKKAYDHYKMIEALIQEEQKDVK
jgi:hypothetical protein